MYKTAFHGAFVSFELCVWECSYSIARLFLNVLLKYDGNWLDIYQHYVSNGIQHLALIDWKLLWNLSEEKKMSKLQILVLIFYSFIISERENFQVYVHARIYIIAALFAIFSRSSMWREQQRIKSPENLIVEKSITKYEKTQEKNQFLVFFLLKMVQKRTEIQCAKWTISAYST